MVLSDFGYFHFLLPHCMFNSLCVLRTFLSKRQNNCLITKYPHSLHFHIIWCIRIDRIKYFFRFYWNNSTWFWMVQYWLIKNKMKTLKLNTYYDNVLIMFLIVITNTTPIYMSQEKRNLASDTLGKMSGTQCTIKTP